jgi:hypothetical protein
LGSRSFVEVELNVDGALQADFANDSLRGKAEAGRKKEKRATTTWLRGLGTT